MANPNPTPPPEKYRFKKGQNRHPNAQPRRGKRITTWLLELGDMALQDWPDPAGLPVSALIAIALMKRALRDDGHRATEIILDRTEGPVKQAVELARLCPEPTMSLETAIDLLTRAGLVGPLVPIMRGASGSGSSENAVICDQFSEKREEK